MTASQQAANRTLLKRLCVVVVAMFGFGYALVPFYEKICEVTGLRNIARADDVPQHAGRHDAHACASSSTPTCASCRGQFRPLEPVVERASGRAARRSMFEIVNTTDRPITGQAIPSYGPQHAAQYFRKLDCFCFATQTLQPGERREMPVVFVIDPSAAGRPAGRSRCRTRSSRSRAPASDRPRRRRPRASVSPKAKRGPQ